MRRTNRSVFVSSFVQELFMDNYNFSRSIFDQNVHRSRLNLLRSTVRAEKGKLAEIRDETCNDLVSSKSKIRTSDKIPEIFDASEIGPRTTFENLARCIRLVSHNDKKQKRRKKTA